MQQEQTLNEQNAVTPAEQVRSDWKLLVNKLSYQGIVSNIPFIAFIVLLCVLYITSNQRTIETQRDLNKNNETLKELRWKYMDVKSRLMQAEMETEIIRSASRIGLKPLTMPAYKILKDSAQQ